MPDVMIVAIEKDSLAILSDLVRQFGDGVLSYDELWAEIIVEFGINGINGINDPEPESGI